MNNTTKQIPDLSYATAELLRFKRDKRSLEARLEAEGEVWKGIYSGGEPSSWIFNSIVNKHADVIDSIPGCVCLPREKRDERYSRALSKIIPVICQRRNFEQTYSDNAWEKLKHGTAVYGVFWNNDLEYGIGDVDIRQIPISSIFWDMKERNIQDSKDLFIASLCDLGEIEMKFGIEKDELRDSNSSLMSDLGYANEGEKCLVVDWYYKRSDSLGGKTLHFCKFVGDRVLYSSEEDPNCENGWYSHGMYPVVFDRLYPTDSAYGFGLIAVSSEVQKHINRIDENMLDYSDWASRVRFWAKRSLGVNEKEFLDLDRGIVEVEGDIDEEKLRQIEIAPIDNSVIDMKRLKIEELKEITGSRDVSQGGVTGGVTAARAISILREAGAKASRDGIEETFRAYITIMGMIIELIRQFYSGERVFRITGDSGDCEYFAFSGKSISAEKNSGRLPHFDIEIKTVKRSPDETEQKNSFAKSLYDSGIFKKENAKEALMMLDLMDFDGIGKLRSSIASAYLAEGEESERAE